MLGLLLITVFSMRLPRPDRLRQNPIQSRYLVLGLLLIDVSSIILCID